MDGLPGQFPLSHGLTLRRAGFHLDAVATKAIDFRLLVSGYDLEILKGKVSKGERLALVPLENPARAATEAYYFLSGSLTFDLPEGPIEIEAGDYLVADDLQKVAMLYAKTEAEFLYICSLPSFHQTSDVHTKLRQLAMEVEVKDGYTADHCERIQSLSYAIGRELGLSHHQLYRLDYGAYFHDIGKIRIPDSILQKPSKLTPEEWLLIQQHPTTGREILEPTFMNIAGSAVEQHHERYDGSGYPYGLKGDEVLIESYIIGIADTYDAMTTDRPYRKALPHKLVLEEIGSLRDRLFPTSVVDGLIRVVANTSPTPQSQSDQGSL